MALAIRQIWGAGVEASTNMASLVPPAIIGDGLFTQGVEQPNRRIRDDLNFRSLYLT